MKIYDLNKIEKKEVRKLLTDSLPDSVMTRDSATIFTDKVKKSGVIDMDLNDHKFTNPILISNLRIEDDTIMGDISLRSYNPHYNNYNSPNGSCSAIDLRKSNKYRIFFKPSFETFLNDDGEFEIVKFKTFSTFLMDKATFREERLSKLLEIK